MPLQIRRGNTAQINNTTPLVGEIVYDTQLKRVVVGDGTTPGGNPIAGVTLNESKDAAAAALLAGTHQNVTFTYNSTTKAISAVVDILTHDTIEADALQASKIFNNTSSVIIDLDTATFNGNVVGNVVGDMKGSLFADDSSVLVNAIDKSFYGTFEGSLITNSISSSDSSPIVVDTPTQFLTNISVDSNSVFKDESQFVTNDADQRIITVDQYHNNATTTSVVSFRRSRGTSSIPANVVNQDILGSIISTGRTATGYPTSTAILSRVSTTPSAGIVPGSLEFYTSDGAGALTERFTIDHLGISTFLGQVNFTYETYSTQPTLLLGQHHDTADARNMVFSRTRGTEATPLSVNNNDDIADLQFAAFDGVDFRTSAVMSVIVDAAPNIANGANSTPGRFEFLTNNGTGLATRVRIDSDGTLEALNNLAVTGRVDFITTAQSTVGAPGAAANIPTSPSTYFRVKVNGTEYVVPAFAVS